MKPKVKRKPTGLRLLGKVLVRSAKVYWRSDSYTLGGALSYYTIFSIAPILIIIIAIAGLVFGAEAAHGEVRAQLEGVLGSSAAQQIQDLVMAAYEPKKGRFAAGIAIFFLILGTGGVFMQIRRALNTLWGVIPKPKRGYLHFIRNRLLSFAMVVCIGFLLLVSLLAHSMLAVFTDYLIRVFPDSSVFVMKVVDILLAFGLTVVLFAMIYKFMSDAKVRWGDTWAGAIFTSALFTLGKYLIGLYLGTTDYSDAYGTAGSIILILVWVDYSSQILFLGAAFTMTYATERGHHIIPQKYAVREMSIEVQQGDEETVLQFQEKLAAVKKKARGSRKR